MSDAFSQALRKRISHNVSLNASFIQRETTQMTSQYYTGQLNLHSLKSNNIVEASLANLNIGHCLWLRSDSRRFESSHRQMLIPVEH